MTVCLDANSGSRAMMHVSPFGQDLGHSTSSDTTSPFPNVQPTGHASMVGIKRERLDTSNESTAASPFPSKARGDSVSPNASGPSSVPEPPTTFSENTDLLHSQDGVPPAYESLSLHRYSNMPSPWFQLPSLLPSAHRARRPILLASILNSAKISNFLKQLPNTYFYILKLYTSCEYCLSCGRRRNEQIAAVSIEDGLHDSDMLLIGRIQKMSLVGSLQPKYTRRTINIYVPEDCANRRGKARGPSWRLGTCIRRSETRGLWYHTQGAEGELGSSYIGVGHWVKRRGKSRELTVIVSRMLTL